MPVTLVNSRAFRTSLKNSSVNLPTSFPPMPCPLRLASALGCTYNYTLQIPDTYLPTDLSIKAYPQESHVRLMSQVFINHSNASRNKLRLRELTCEVEKRLSRVGSIITMCGKNAPVVLPRQRSCPRSGWSSRPEFLVPCDAHGHGRMKQLRAPGA